MVFYGCVLATLAASLTIIGLPSSVWLISYHGSGLQEPDLAVAMPVYQSSNQQVKEQTFFHKIKEGN